MARGLRWRVPFVSLDGVAYTVNIYDEGWTGEAKVLRGATHPFVIDEPEDDDLMKPSRLTSGLLSLVLDEDEPELMPTDKHDRFVTLTITETSDVLWQGYIQPSMYDQEWGPYPKDLSLNLCSAVASLDEIEVNTENLALRSIGQLIKEALDATGATWRYVYFPTEWKKPTGHFYDVMRVQSMKTVWVEKTEAASDSPVWKLLEGKSYLKMLEDIALAFGWTIYERDTDLYLMTFGETNYSRLAYSQLDSPTGMDDSGYSTVHGLPSMAGADNRMTTIDRHQNFDITANAVEMPFAKLTINTGADGVLYHRTFDTFVAAERKHGYEYVFDRSVLDVRLNQYVVEYDDEVPQDIVEEDLGVERLTNMWHGTDNDFGYGAALTKMDSFQPDPTKKNYNFTDKIVIASRFKGQNDYYYAPTRLQMESHPVITFDSVVPVFAREGCLNVRIDGTGVGSMHIRVQFGNQYWNGNMWTDTPSWFDYAGDQKTLDMPYNGEAGMFLPITAMMSGRIKVDVTFLDRQPLYSEITDMVVQVLEPDNVVVARSEDKHYYSEAFGSKDSVEQITPALITLNNHKPAKNSLVLDGQLLSDQMEWKGERIRPEIALLRKYEAVKGVKRDKITATIKYSHDQPFCRMLRSGQQYAKVATSTDIWAGTMDLTIVKL